MNSVNHEKKTDKKSNKTPETPSPPCHPLSYFTVWNYILLGVYETIVTFLFSFKNFNSSFEKKIMRLHFTCFTLQLFIFVFYFAFQARQVEKYNKHVWSRKTINGVHLIHVTPVMILFMENLFFRYELETLDIIYPAGFAVVYTCFNIYIFVKYNVKPYPQLDWSKKIAYIFIGPCIIFLLIASYFVILLRSKINNWWS